MTKGRKSEGRIERNRKAVACPRHRGPNMSRLRGTTCWHAMMQRGGIARACRHTGHTESHALVASSWILMSATTTSQSVPHLPAASKARRGLARCRSGIGHPVAAPRSAAGVLQRPVHAHVDLPSFRRRFRCWIADLELASDRVAERCVCA